MRRPIIVGNWKMNLLLDEAVELARSIRERLARVEGIDIGVCPPFPYLYVIEEIMTGTNIAVGAQNLHHERRGAFTGEVSAPMLESVNVDMVIVGHSERRKYFNETDETIRQKLSAAVDFGLAPILCVGETLNEREAGKAEEVVLRQLNGALQGFDSSELHNLIIAYEPVWAIGTGRTATPDIAEEMHSLIRKTVGERLGEEFADALRIQYGGSVKPENIEELMLQPDIDGALVGGASLKAETFSTIVLSAKKAKGV